MLHLAAALPPVAPSHSAGEEVVSPFQAAVAPQPGPEVALSSKGVNKLVAAIDYHVRAARRLGTQGYSQEAARRYVYYYSVPSEQAWQRVLAAGQWQTVVGLDGQVYLGPADD